MLEYRTIEDIDYDEEQDLELQELGRCGFTEGQADIVQSRLDHAQFMDWEEWSSRRSRG